MVLVAPVGPSAPLPSFPLRLRVMSPSLRVKCCASCQVESSLKAAYRRIVHIDNVRKLNLSPC